MNYATPESKGISSEAIKRYIDLLEEYRMALHSVIIARGDDIVYEQYWEPFHADFLHRIYSSSKSIVALAVGFAEQDGLLNLDDPMSKFFAKELEGQEDQNMHDQTVRHMLMMSTCKPQENWFVRRPEDRVHLYFQNPNTHMTRPSGTLFEYDSTGSFVLGALVERLTGKPMMEYLKEKFMRRIGVSEDVYCLTCPGGHAWGDSGVMCRATDFLKIARFVLNKGRWEGEQLLNEEFITAATTKQIFNNPMGLGDYEHGGYGYLFWIGQNNRVFSFLGMGTQIAVCVPDRDMILIVNGDTHQGHGPSEWLIVGNFLRMIADTAADQPLPENPTAQAALQVERKLGTAVGDSYVPFQDKINGVEFEMKENRMGITKFSLHFDGEGHGRFDYTNAQGDKSIPFGMCENVFDKFPQEGYSDDVGSVRTKGFYYDCAASAAWVEPQKLFLKVQIIDRYFGRLDVTLGFLNEDRVGVWMTKHAEDFLNEYAGFGEGRAKR